MKISFSIPKLGMLLALFIICYQNISAMLWEPVSAATAISFIMLIISVISLYVLVHRGITFNSISFLKIPKLPQFFHKVKGQTFVCPLVYGFRL